MTHAEKLHALTLAEKARLLSGANFWNTAAIERLGIPSIMLTDGPHGIRKQAGAADHLGLNQSLPSTCFPPAATLANSWDPDLAYTIGRALGAEAAAQGVSVVLGPGLNIKRSPLAGRNFEYFSEDPYLTGELAAAMTRGIQSTGVAACPKHFAVNSQEYNRMVVDEIVDERALHELYLEAFRKTVQEADPLTVMSSYNRVNGVYAHENEHLLNKILREEWGFEGAVISDWGGTNDRVKSVIAGGTLEMPSAGVHAEEELAESVRSGNLTEADLNRRVKEVLRLIDKTAGVTPKEVDAAKHHDLAIAAAVESAVLLTNDGTLPLCDPDVPVAVIGSFAADPRYQGAGSSLVNPTRLDNALEALPDAGINVVGYEPGFKRFGALSKRLQERALRLAEKAEIILLFIGLDEAAEAEGRDRRHMRLPQSQLRLTKKLIQTGKPIVVVLAGGAPVELPFADHVAAILHSYLGGQGGGQAVAELLTGQANPSGKLAETYPLKYEHTPAAPWYLQAKATAEHRESIYIGYRYYDKAEQDVQFPFGHGLSYTDFEYSDLHVNPEFARFTLTNTGNRKGTEIVQVYVRPQSSGFWAPQELRGFARVELDAGESAAVEVKLDEHSFHAYFPGSGWQQVGGRYDIAVGSSSRRLPLVAPLEVNGQLAPTSPAAPYTAGLVHQVDENEFSALLGRPLPDAAWPDGDLHENSVLVHAATKSAVGKLIKVALGTARRALILTGRPAKASYTDFVAELPLRALSRMSAGRVSPEVLPGIIKILNGNYWQGIKALLLPNMKKLAEDEWDEEEAEQ